MMKETKSLMQITADLIDVVGPVSTRGYLEGKTRIKSALEDILDEPAKAPEVFSFLQAQGYLRFANRVGLDTAEAHWRIVKNPIRPVN